MRIPVRVVDQSVSRTYTDWTPLRRINIPGSNGTHARATAFGNLVGESPRMHQVYAQIDKAAHTDLPVLIFGETGTGKEVVAGEIHARSARAAKAFVAVNTGALPRELIASELFGHKRGAFTGASDDKLGRFREASGGTLFLDEIGTMEERVQVALLRVLEDGIFRPVGATADQHVDVRLVAATNEDPQLLARQGRFRYDLLYRFDVMRIELPPLRDIPDDLPLLVDHFIAAFSRKFDLAVRGASKPVLDALIEYQWPGNIRELKNVIAQACVMAERGLIDFEHVPSRVLSAHARLEAASNERSQRESMPTASAPKSVSAPAWMPAMSPEAREANDIDGVYLPLGSSLDDVERTYVMRTLTFCNNNKTRAAKVLGVSRKTLYDRLDRWGYSTNGDVHGPLNPGLGGIDTDRPPLRHLD